MTQESEPTPIAVETMLSPVMGLGNVLPPGAVKYNKPLTSRDYIITDKMNQAAADALLYQNICDVRQTMEPGGRLYVLMGENHTAPTHLMAQAGLLENMTAASRQGDTRHGALLYALELPYDFLQDIADSYGLFTSPAIRPRLHKQDPLSHHFARAALAQAFFQYAPESKKRCLDSCLRNNIPMTLVDAGRTENQKYLDPSDELATKTAQKLFNIDIAQTKLSLVPEFNLRSLLDHNKSLKGIAVRNAVMAQRIVKAAEEHKADTVVVSTGLYHLGGSDLSNAPYDTSLTHFMKEQISPQDKILPVACFGSPFLAYLEMIPSALWCDNPDTLIIRGLCEDPHVYGGAVNTVLRVFGINVENRFISELGESYVHASQPVPPWFNVPSCPDKKIVRQQLKELIFQAKINLPSMDGPF